MIVAVEPANEGVTVYHRDGAEVWNEFEEYQPWLLIHSEPWHFLHKKTHTFLEGGNKYDRLIEYGDWRTFYKARSLAAENGHDMLAYTSPAKNYLMRTGQKMFEGAAFNDPVRLTIDIETTGIDPKSSEVFMIAMLDNRGNEEVLVGDEPTILKQMVRAIRDVDPDTIEGHNLLAFDLPFIMARMEAKGLPPLLGRGGKSARIGRIRKMMIGPNEKWYNPVYIAGRHVIDTLLQVQKYDAQIMRHSSYGLKAVAREYGIEEPDRIELDRSVITETYRTDPKTVEVYALQDVRETQRLADLILPVEFMQCNYVPDGYQGVCVTGNGEKWNSILVSYYLGQGRSIPERQHTGAEYIGAFTECRVTGIIERVVKADVESLYPSLMLTRNLEPATDTDHVLLTKLQELKDARIAAKRKMQNAKTGEEKNYHDGFQQSAKILINSAYGFMGGPFHYGDVRAAEGVTTGGREIITLIIDDLDARGCQIIEVDTDGVMFVPPDGCHTQKDEEALVAEVGEELPSGIILAHDGRYAKMLSLKAKNYVLLDYDGKRTYKGSSLKSRSAEAFGKDFLKEAIDALFDGDPDRVVGLYNGLLRDLYDRRVLTDSLVRRERITEKTHKSSAKRRLSAVGAGIPVGEFIFIYEKEDGTLALADDYAQDDNRLYYMQRLWKYADRLRDLYPTFDQLFEKPGKRNFLRLGGVSEEERAKAAGSKIPRKKRILGEGGHIPQGAVAVSGSTADPEGLSSRSSSKRRDTVRGRSDEVHGGAVQVDHAEITPGAEGVPAKRTKRQARTSPVWVW